MDDNPWGDTPSSPSTSKFPPPSLPPPQPSKLFVTDDDFSTADFEDDVFNEPTSAFNAEDDFGDFGDAAFEETEIGNSAPYDDDFRIIPQPTHVGWQPLDLDPLPSTDELDEAVADLVKPIWAGYDMDQCFTDEAIRQTEGINRVLSTPESRNLFNLLLNSNPPNLRPPNWIRSRIRRQHLITLGIPINLDEVMPHANGKALPTLEVTTRPASAPPGHRPNHRVAESTAGSNVPSRSGTPVGRASGSVSQPPRALSPKPTVDSAKVDAIMNLNPDTLPLLPLPLLEAHLKTLREVMAETSSVLTHLLQTRDGLQQDSETYNGLIAELVGEATKAKMKSKARPTKRGTS